MRKINLSIITLAILSCSKVTDGSKSAKTIKPIANEKPAIVVSGDTAAPAQVVKTASKLAPPETPGTVSPKADIEPSRIIKPGEKVVIRNDEAEISLDGNEISKPTKFGIKPLTAAELPAVEGSITNVTKGPRSGYRFTPTPAKFNDKLLVALPYDPALLPPGKSPSDIRTFYFDKAQGQWLALTKVTTDTSRNVVISETDHFTDMINATVTVPDHPEGVSFNPNQIKDIRAADPGAEFNLIDPPRANNTGDARLSYAIEVPPGRQKLQPQLSINYNSSGGNGWLGIGWDLSVPMVTVDTRWGAPRYSGTHETETYLLNGEQLTPVAHRGSLQARTPEKIFHTRVEGQFRRIVRHGDNPTNYTWEVTEKNGTVHTFGTIDPSTQILADAEGNRFLWAISQTKDANGNTITYRYTRVNDPGVPGGSVVGTNIYISSINYTGFGGADGAYNINFIRDRDLGESRRADVQIDARGGFKRVAADLLRRINITFNGQLVRYYDLRYNENAYGDGRPGIAFNKTLLTSINQYTKDGIFFNSHKLTYYDEARDSSGNYHGFQTTTSWNVGNDNVSAGLLGEGAASAIGGSKSLTVGNSFYFGAGVNDFLFMSKSLTSGFHMEFSSTKSETLISMTDINGDGLPDKVFKGSDGIYYRPNIANPFGQTGYGSPIKIGALSRIGKDNTTTTTAGSQVNIGATLSFDVSDSITQSDTYLTDVNGDGLVDLVDGGLVRFGYVATNGTINFSYNSADTPVAVGSGAIDTSSLLTNMGALEAQRAANFPLLDSVRAWVAPYSGTIKITGNIQLIENFSIERAQNSQVDGVRAAIQLENGELASIVIGPNDYSVHSFSNVSAITVNRGDRLYFRVNSVFNGAFDQVNWAPVITYTQLAGGTLDLNQTDANNLPEFRYTAASEFTTAGKGGSTKAPLTGTLHLGGMFVKSAITSDNVSLVLFKNGSEVYRQEFTDQQVTSVGISQDIAVTQLDDLEWRVLVDSRIDVSRISFSPVAWYTSAQGVPTVTDENGAYALLVNIPFDIDLYPVSYTTSPVAAYTVPAPSQQSDPDTRSLPVMTTMTFAGLSINETHSGVFVVKKRTGLVAKREFTVVGTGAPTQDFPILVSATVTTGDVLFFEIDSRDPKFSEKLTQVITTIGSAMVTAAVNQRAVDGLFGQSFRGWYYFGYNGSAPRDIAPIDQNLLVLTANTDPNTLKVYAYSPEPAAVGGRWGILDNRGWITASQISSTRIGIDDIRMPTGAQFAGASAPPRISQSKNTALGAITSGTVGTNKSLIDFQDLNGDRFPDVIGENGVQYTTAMGGLEPRQRPSIIGGCRNGSSEGRNFSLSSNTFQSIANARGQIVTTGKSSSTGGFQGPANPSFGFGGSLGSGSSTTEMDLIDINGDSLPDKVYPNGEVELNLGYSFAPRENWGSGIISNGQTDNQGINLGFDLFSGSLSGGLSLSKGKTTSNEIFVDVNGDGLPDKIIGGSPLLVRLNTGSGYTSAFAWPGGHTSVAVDNHISLGGGGTVTFGIPCCAIVPAVKFSFSTGVNLSTSMGRPEIMFRDMDGDGFVDHVKSTRDSELLVAANPIGRTNLLKRVDRPLGANFTISYVRAGNTYELPHSRWNMSQVTVFDGHVGEGVDTQTTNYAYAEPHYDRLERDFYGYRSVSETQLNTAQGNAPYRQILRSYISDSFYGKGLMRFEQVRDATGALFTETENTYVIYDVDNGTTLNNPLFFGTAFPQLVRTDKRFYEGTGSVQKATYTLQEYDALGNVTRFVDVGDSGSTDDIEAIITYSNCQDNYIIEPIEIKVYGGGDLMRRRQSDLDCATGNVTQVRQFIDGSNVAVTDLSYEANGNLKEVTGPANKSGQRYKLTYTYDSVVQTHVTQIVDSFGLTSLMSHEYFFGKPVSITDTNGQTISYAYDSAGRTTSIVGPYEQGTNDITISFEYHPFAAVPYAVTRHIDKDAVGNYKPTGTIDTVLFIDGLKRVIQTKKDGAVFTSTTTSAQERMIVSGQVRFDAFGRTVEQYYPVTEAKGAANFTYNTAVDSVNPTLSQYDILDRNTSTTLPDNTTTSSVYSFGQDRAGVTQFETRVTDALGKVKLSYRNVRGLITTIKEFAGAQALLVSYKYDALAQITEVKDDQSNKTTVTYDNLGRRTAIDNPDTGLTEMGYDAAGNMITKITAKLRSAGQRVEYDYDYNRLVAIRYPNFTANNVTYIYGNAAAGGNANGNRAGRVVMVSDASGTEERFYGPLGEITKEIKALPATLRNPSSSGIYTTEYQWDSWNRLQRLTYADGEVLTYSYDAGGLVASAVGVKNNFHYSYLARLDYDKFGQRVYMVLGNGVKTSYSYDSANRRLATLKSQLPVANAYQFQNLAYSYDAVGNITQLTNTVVIPDTLQGSDKKIGNLVGGPSTQTFQYDDLYRLTGATGTYQNTSNRTNTYTLSMAYDSIHNIVSKNQLHQIILPSGNPQTQSATSYNFAYQYTSGRPHAVSSVGAFNMAYDANGNLIRRETVANNQTRQLIWDEENRLACTREGQNSTLPQVPASCGVAGSSNAPKFVYNAAGTRVVKDAGPKAITVNQNYSENGNKAYKHIFIGTQRLLTKAVNTNNKPETTQWFYHSDHLSSSSHTTNAEGKLNEHLAYFPYGETWVHENPSMPIQYGFTAKELDAETGYYYFGARYYDPRVSTWISTDPALLKYLPGVNQKEKLQSGGIYRSQNLNMFQYAFLNPMKFIDPNGLWVDQGDGSFVAEKGDTLNGLQAQTGRDWRTSNFKGDPRKLQVGQNVSFAAQNSQQRGPVVDSTAQAYRHYKEGGGEPVVLGTGTSLALENHPEQRRRLDRIRNGETDSLSGNYAVDMTSEVFHVGQTRVDYNTTCGSKFCVTDFSGFTQDGFWDITGINNDRMGPGGELFGGQPYPYIPHNWTRSFSNPYLGR